MSVNLQDYQVGGGGFGQGSMTELAELQKALSVGHLAGSDPANTSAGSLKVESLERTLKDLEYKERDLALWRYIPKLPAYSTVEEYERLLDYGQDIGGFINEGDLPDETDSTFERVAELVKYIGTTRSVTLQAQLVNTVVNNLQKQQMQSGTKWVMRKADRALSFGDSAIIPAEFNGLFTLHKNGFSTLASWQDSQVVIDLRGSHISEGAMEEAAQAIVDFHGDPNLFIGSTDVISNFAKQFHGKKWIQPSTTAVTAGVVGQRVKQFASQFGDIDMAYDKFMNDQRPKVSITGASHAKAPLPPTPDGVNPVVTVADALTQFTDGAGDYYVAITSINRHGESALAFLDTSLISVASNESMDLKFTPTAGAYSPTGYRVYLSKKDESLPHTEAKMYPVFAVSSTQLANGFDGGAAGIVRNRNRFMPDTRKALLMENSPEVYSFKQLAPIMKMDLARISTADRFMVLLFGTPQLYAPKKMVVFINVGAYVAP